jgi:resorcinol 4-hydroxylase (FADH2)
MPTNTHPVSPDESIARAIALARKLTERTNEGTKLRRVPDATVADFIDAGLHKLLQPSRYGGWASGWETHVSIAVELAQGDGSQAWVLTGYSDNAHLVGNFAKQAQDEVWSASPDSLVCASSTVGRLVPKQGGYVASGKWSFASGIDHASWLIGRGLVEDTDRQRKAYFLVPKPEAKVVDDWDVTGLVGTGSKSFSLDEVFIPPNRILDDNDLREGKSPGAAANQELVYKFPREGVSLALAAVSLGIAAAMLEDFVTLACDTAKRGLRVQSNFATALRISESKAEIDGARLSVIAAARETMQMLERGDAPTAERRAINSLRAAFAALSAARAADRLFAAAGAKANLLASRLQHHLLDIHAAGAQDEMSWDSTASQYGRLRLGENLSAMSARG